jgi:hypothetical protein
MILGQHYFYCFVDFQEPLKDSPVVYVVPSGVVAEAVTASHQKWLMTPGAKGQMRKDGPMRRFLPDYGRIWATENPYPPGWLGCLG